MTERKPADLSFESWVDRQIREAAERGEFDNLKGTGEPLPDVDQPYDELWWVKRKLRDEKLSYLPSTLALRKEAEDALEAVAQATTEEEARRILTALNQKIRRRAPAAADRSAAEPGAARRGAPSLRVARAARGLTPVAPVTGRR